MAALSNAHCLVVGIASYQHVRPLPDTVVKDAQDVHDVLVDPVTGGYPRERVRLLTDAAATRAALHRGLSDIATRADDQSVVFVYLSGHGARITGGPFAGQYLLPVDTAADSPASLAETAVSGEEFSQWLQAIPARKVVVIFDCCHAGGVGVPKSWVASEPATGLSERYYEALQAGRGRAILASSRSNEYSFVPPGADNSIFTKHLLAGLRGGISSDDGLVRVFDLFEYLQPRVTADQPRQHPVFKADLEENFPVALWRGGRRGTITTDRDGFRFDAYISYVDRDPDSLFVWEKLVPRLEAAGLRLAVSGDVEQPGVARVVSIERGIRQSRRTVMVLSPNYLDDGIAEFENVVAQTIGIQEGSWRPLPVRIGPVDNDRMPVRLGMLTSLDLVHPRRSDQEFHRLLEALRGPLPKRA
jgi:hypothetical protein